MGGMLVKKRVSEFTHRYRIPCERTLIAAAVTTKS